MGFKVGVTETKEQQTKNVESQATQTHDGIIASCARKLEKAAVRCGMQ